MTLRAIDVCAGAGGFSLGLHRAGWQTLGVEIDADAVETHRRHVGPCEIADVTTWHPSAPAELVVGGVPCQSFSVAGERKGLEDPRGQLYRHLVRIADEASSRMVILENVRGLLSTPGAIAAIVAEMQSRGFSDVRYTALCAADYGTPQRRYRLFVVGLRGVSWRWPAPTHGDGPMAPLFGLKPWVTVRQALGLGPRPRRHGRIDGAVGWNGQRMLDVDGLAPTVTSRTNPELLDAPAPTISAGGTGGGGGAEPLANREMRDRFHQALAGASSRDAPALTLGAGHDTYPDGEASRALHEALVVAGLSERPATTIAGDSRVWAGDCKPGDEQKSRNAGAVRLVVDQCAVLQGFPSGWVWEGNKASQHRQVGNAVPPQLGEALGREAARGLECAN